MKAKDVEVVEVVEVKVVNEVILPKGLMRGLRRAVQIDLGISGPLKIIQP